jgi:hypothetical protein
VAAGGIEELRDAVELGARAIELRLKPGHGARIDAHGLRVLLHLPLLVVEGLELGQLGLFVVVAVLGAGLTRVALDQLGHLAIGARKELELEAVARRVGVHLVQRRLLVARVALPHDVQRFLARALLPAVDHAFVGGLLRFESVLFSPKLGLDLDLDALHGAQRLEDIDKLFVRHCLRTTGMPRASAEGLHRASKPELRE